METLQPPSSAPKEQRTKAFLGRVLELRDVGDGTAHLLFRDQLPLELIKQIRAIVKSGRGSAIPC